MKEYEAEDYRHVLAHRPPGLTGHEEAWGYKCNPEPRRDVHSCLARPLRFSLVSSCDSWQSRARTSTAATIARQDVHT